jgi:hypothetical protein
MQSGRAQAVHVSAAGDVVSAGKWVKHAVAARGCAACLECADLVGADHQAGRRVVVRTADVLRPRGRRRGEHGTAQHVDSDLRAEAHREHARLRSVHERAACSASRARARNVRTAAAQAEAWERIRRRQACCWCCSKGPWSGTTSSRCVQDTKAGGFGVWEDTHACLGDAARSVLLTGRLRNVVWEPRAALAPCAPGDMLAAPGTARPAPMAVPAVGPSAAAAPDCSVLKLGCVPDRPAPLASTAASSTAVAADATDPADAGRSASEANVTWLREPPREAALPAGFPPAPKSLTSETCANCSTPEFTFKRLPDMPAARASSAARLRASSAFSRACSRDDGRPLRPGRAKQSTRKSAGLSPARLAQELLPALGVRWTGYGTAGQVLCGWIYTASLGVAPALGMPHVDVHALAAHAQLSACGQDTPGGLRRAGTATEHRSYPRRACSTA